MRRPQVRRWFPFGAVLLASGCAPSAPAGAGATPLPAAALVATIGGFSGPESVRYDPEQDVYFVSNFNGPAGERDNNGFISRVRPDGTVENLRWAAGGVNSAELHSPRGMFITGDTLWAADLGAVRGFHRLTGMPVATVDLSGMDPGFPNDIAQGPDRALYVSDTGRNRVYRVAGRTATIALEDTTLNRPNGIAWDRFNDRLLLLPFGGRTVVYGWRPGQGGPVPVAVSPGGAFDGAEVLDANRFLLSSQNDSSVQLVTAGQGRKLIPLAGRPADLGVDTRRNRVLVPYVARNEVEIWQLP